MFYLKGHLFHLNEVDYVIHLCHSSGGFITHHFNTMHFSNSLVQIEGALVCMSLLRWGIIFSFVGRPDLTYGPTTCLCVLE